MSNLGLLLKVQILSLHKSNSQGSSKKKAAGLGTLLILGGYERGQDFNELKPFIKNVKAIIGIGETRERVLEFGKTNNIDTYIFETQNEGFSKITKIMKSGDVVLLSPASASWDKYNRCEERGDEFKNLVNEL